MVSLICILLIVHIVQISALLGNNACKHFRDYLSLSSSRNCWYDPDAELNTPQLILKYVGDLQEHKVTTEDGYILTVHRLPRSRPKGVVLMQHPLFTDSRVYMTQGNASTALFVWRAGYDVWLGNQRGTLHSQRHLRLTTADRKYWDYSFDEIGQYDISAIIKYVRSKTGVDKIIYYGHSLGTTNALVYSSMRPEEAHNSVRAFIFTGTSLHFQYTTSSTQTLVVLEPFIKPIVEALNLGALIPFISVVIQFIRIAVRNFPLLLIIAHISMLTSLGWTPDEADPVILLNALNNVRQNLTVKVEQNGAIFNADVAVIIRNVSWRLAFHYIQLLGARTRFQMYDYGPVRNRRIYGSDRPNLYPVENITVPIYMICSKNDALTTVGDAEWLFNNLQERAKVYGKKVIEGLNHIDYIYGKHRKELFVDHLLDILQRIEGVN